ncbi:MAG: hypothetical protein IRZ20_02310 [Thermoleophilia bacterium]|nr:hypothetical protein [Thermoleophilia bacterium]
MDSPLSPEQELIRGAATPGAPGASAVSVRVPEAVERPGASVYPSRR